MKSFRTLKKVALLRNYIGMLVAGLFFLAIGIFVFTLPEADRVEATAKIVKIEQVYEHGETTNNVYVDYTDSDGVSYNNVLLNEYIFTMHEGDEITVYYNVADRLDLTTGQLDFLPVFAIAIGGLLVAVGIIFTVKTAMTKAETMSDIDRADMSGATDVEICNIESNSSDREHFYFHFTGKMNQSYVLEDVDRRPVYEAKMVKFTLFKATPYEFIDHETGYRQERKIGHTVTVSVGGGDILDTGFPVSSYFKIDGKKVWDVLAEKGYGIDLSLEGMALCGTIKHYGVEIATFRTAGTNALKDGKTGKLGNIPVNGIYELDCAKSEIEYVFLTMFALSRTEYTE